MAALLTLLVVSYAWAGALRVQLFTKVRKGQTPRLVLTAKQRAGKVTVTLQRDDGKKLVRSIGTMTAGRKIEVRLDPKEGEHHYTGKIVAMVRGSKRISHLDFTSVVAAPLKISVDRARVDLDNHVLEITLNHPGNRVVMKVMDETGAQLDLVRQDISSSNAGQPIRLGWHLRPGQKVARIEIRAYDSNNFYSGIALIPWSIEIPHQEVNFDTNASSIRPSELPKLQDSLHKILSATRKYRALGRVSLFVVGHTDTVASVSHNLTLSRRRAQSIARWFRAHGMRNPIFATGLGECSLRVKTADNVSEERNRRADYILSIEPPHLMACGKPAGWHPVK